MSKGKIEDYKWVKVDGDAWTPARLWRRTFATEEEYQALSDVAKKEFYPINDKEREYLEKHWDSLWTEEQVTKFYRGRCY